MADVIHRTTLEQQFSVNTAVFSPATWIINPDLSALSGVEKKYWKIVGDTVVEMTQPEKDAVDTADLPGVKTDRKTFLYDSAESYLSNKYLNNEADKLSELYIDALSDRPNRSSFIKPFIEWREEISVELTTRLAAVDAAVDAAAVNAIVIDEASLDASDPAITFAGAMGQSDTLALSNFLDTNAVVTDATSGVSGPFLSMQTLVNRRELFNDVDNPIYDSGITPLLGAGGSVQNLNDIHGKLGWHNQLVVNSLYHRPKDLLIYYGWLNSFNSGANSFTNELVAQDMAKYELIVLGDGVQDPGHGDYANSQVIIPRIQALNPMAKIFGYVTVNQVLANLQTKVDQWDTLGVNGIFMDEAGYDFGTTATNDRPAFNTKVDYVHGKTTSNLCFANAWNTDHILGTTNDVSFPNATWNTTPAESNLTIDDWILLESFPINTGNPVPYEDDVSDKAGWAARGSKAISLRSQYGVNFAAVGILDNSSGSAQALFDFGFASTLMFSLGAYGTSDTSYASGSAAVTFWPRPSVADFGCMWSLNPSVQVDVVDADVYHRYVEHGKMTLDFSSGAKTSSLISH